ncbi:MAG: glycosyltransferase [Beutenbergiaceae bacterium]
MSTSTDKPHLLYLAWGFPPCRGGGVYRALATANMFAQAGWRVTVVTADRETFTRNTGIDPSLEQEIDPSVEVVRVPFDWPAQNTDIGSYSRLKVLAPPVWRKVRSKLDQITFPEITYGPWLRRISEAVADIHSRDPINLTIATANPNVVFAAAHRLYKQAGVPYVMDYRDAWLLNVFSGAQAYDDRSRPARLEAEYIADATEVWFVNEPIRAWHAERYPGSADRMHVVSNGWDPNLLSTQDGATVEKSEPGAGLRFGYLGTVSGKVPLKQLVSAWNLAIDNGWIPEGSELHIGGYLGYYAIPNSRMLDIITRGQEHGVKYVGPVPKKSVGQFYADLDVLVLALGTGKYVTSGKVFEYIATGKPILSAHHVDNAASTVLEGHPSWVLPHSLATTPLAWAMADVALQVGQQTEQQRQRTQEFALQYRRDRQFGPRITALTKLVSA